MRPDVIRRNVRPARGGMSHRAPLLLFGGLLWGVLLFGVLLWGCGDGEAPRADPGPGAEPERSAITETRDALEGALARLVAGPSGSEGEPDHTSWFSGETAETLNSVEIDAEGHAVVDFHDLRPLIPGASSSAGSEALLTELNQAVFRFDEVRSVEYRMEGSCSLFWEWLQYGCQVVLRPE